MTQPPYDPNRPPTYYIPVKHGPSAGKVILIILGVLVTIAILFVIFVVVVIQLT